MLASSCQKPDLKKAKLVIIDGKTIIKKKSEKNKEKKNDAIYHFSITYMSDSLIFNQVYFSEGLL